MTASKASRAIGTRPGCATQVPSWPSLASRSLSARTFASASSLATGSFLIGIWAAMPPIAWASRRVAGLDRQQRVGPHEVGRHRHQGAVGQHEVRVAAELLDDAEDVVPAAAVEPGRVLAQLVEDLVHLEGGEDRLDEDGGADGAPREPRSLLDHQEDVVPEARLEVALELGQVEVRPRALGQQGRGVVEHVEREVEDARPRPARRRPARASPTGASRAGAPAGSRWCR